MFVLTLLLCALPSQTSSTDVEQGGHGQALERVSCSSGYGAFVFASGLSAPDGMALDREGRLCVVEEGAGRVVRLNERGEITILASGLHSPEGICLGPRGDLLVVEDVADGRLLSIAENGEVQVLRSELEGAEGVLYLDGKIYWTQSNIQFAQQKLAARTSVLVSEREGPGWGAPRQLFTIGLPFSFSELVADGPGHLIVANELAGTLLPPGLMRLDLGTLEFTHFSEGLVSPEGLAWTSLGEGRYPLVVAEEDVDGQGHGRVSRVDASGERKVIASDFGTIEDVLVNTEGHIFVTEDSSGLVIVLRPKP